MNHSITAWPRSRQLLAVLALFAGTVFGNDCGAQAPAVVGASKTGADPAWILTGKLIAPRWGHSATLLHDGKVLVAGGVGAGVRQATAELYDPQTGAWTTTGQLNRPRFLHVAVLLPDGRVLVAGGTLDGSTELYDPASGSWNLSGNLNVARQMQATAALLDSGKVLIAAGCCSNGAAVSSAELYDPGTGNWSMTGSLHVARYVHTMTLLQGGNVLIAGGYLGDWSSETDSCELYDPTTGAWTEVGGLSRPSSGHAATLLPNGNVLVSGGYFNDTEWYGAMSWEFAQLFDPASRTWSATGSLGIGRNAHTATLLASGEVLIAGGEGLGGEVPRANVGGTERYATNSAKWFGSGALSVARRDHTATRLLDGRVLVAGGWANFAALDSAELYLPSIAIDAGFTGTWYDPAQGGHGIFIEVLPDNRFLAWWFAFNPDGTEQSWFGGVGTYSGSSAAITDVVRTTGGSWVNGSGQGQVANEAWGTLRFTFDGRDHGRVDFESLAGYGSGSMSLTRLTQPLVSAAAIAGNDSKNVAAIGSGYSGVWYDPARSGQGLFVEVLPDSRLLAWWFTFNPGGTEQAWFGGVGSISGSTATISDVVQTTGGRWIPNFASSQVVNNPWGTLRLEFTDCNHGRVEFDSVRGYGSGGMDLTRLTQPAGLACP